MSPKWTLKTSNCQMRHFLQIFKHSIITKDAFLKYLDRGTCYCNLISSLSDTKILKNFLNFPKPNKKGFIFCQIIVIMALCQAYDKNSCQKRTKGVFSSSICLLFFKSNLLRHLLKRQQLLIKSLLFLGWLLDFKLIQA